MVSWQRIILMLKFARLLKGCHGELAENNFDA
jgi:hypothetical protein